MNLNDLLDLQTGDRYRHNKTGVEYELREVAQINISEFRVTLRDDAGRSFTVPPATLETLYTKLDEPEPVGILPIGSVAIDDGPDADPEPGQDIELEFTPKRPGRRRVERPERR